MPHYEGELFNGTWDEQTGGSLLGLDLSKDVPLVIKDLMIIDVNPILKNTKLSKIDRFAFNHKEYLADFQEHLGRFLNVGALSKEDVEIARSAIQRKFESPPILNNGDFYPRNFIRTKHGRIVLIDWDTWSDKSRANIIDHPENVAAFCFVHMWSNPEWQKEYIRELKDHFGFKKENFQVSIMIKSIEMSYFWFVRNASSLFNHQIRIFKDALSDDYMDDLWKK
jgi:hypothetical protein